MKILVIHGPNMNLIGIRSKNEGQTITLGKINSNLRKIAKKHNIDLKILQTHSQTKANKFLHSNRKISDGLLLTPNTWNDYGYTLKDSIELIKIPSITILFNKSNSIFNNIIIDKDPIIAFNKAFEKLLKKISN